MNYLYIALISMVPLIELRGAIPVSQGLGLPIIPSYIVCIFIHSISYFFDTVYYFLLIIFYFYKEKATTVSNN